MAPQTPTSPPKRPWPVTLLALLVLFIAGVHWMKFVIAIQQWDTLKRALTQVSPLYLALTGLGWGVVSLPFVWGLWTGRPWAWLGIQIAGTLYVLAAWADLLWVAAPDLAPTRWPFTLGLSILGLSFLFAAVHCSACKRFFKGKHLGKISTP